MKVIETTIPDLLIIEPLVFEDARGLFLESYQKKRYIEFGISCEFVQDNYSRSMKNVLRGLHYQKHRPQGKLVRVVEGEVYDVAVDLRKDSPTFGKWFGLILSSQAKNQFFIPPGFAHGFQVLSDSADFEYKCSEYYDPKDEETILWNDSTLNIKWPLENPLLSEKDLKGKSFLELFS